MTQQKKYPIAVCKEHQIPGRKYGFPSFKICDVCGKGEICCEDLTEENLIPIKSIKPTKSTEPTKPTKVYILMAKMIVNMITGKMVEDIVVGTFSTYKKANEFLQKCKCNQPSSYKNFKDGTLLEDALEAYITESEIDGIIKND